MQEDESRWLCPWCREFATLPGNPSGICESKRCQCGGLGIAAPSRDSDEIIDDAIGIFGIAEGCLTPYNSDRVAGLQRIGVEVLEGQRVPADADNRLEWRVLWFRK